MNPARKTRPRSVTIDVYPARFIEQRTTRDVCFEMPPHSFEIAPDLRVERGGVQVAQRRLGPLATRAHRGQVATHVEVVLIETFGETIDETREPHAAGRFDRCTEEQLETIVFGHRPTGISRPAAHGATRDRMLHRLGAHETANGFLPASIELRISA
jgi:hypothetical protein